MYWNYKSYVLNKEQFKKDVQLVLDNALEKYYVDLASNSSVTLFSKAQVASEKSNGLPTIDKLAERLNDSMLVQWNRGVKNDSFIHVGKDGGITNQGARIGSYLEDSLAITPDKIKSIHVYKNDTVANNLQQRVTSIFISIQEDEIDFNRLDSLITIGLQEKSFDFPYALTQYENDSLVNTFSGAVMQPTFLKMESVSNYLKEDESLQIHFPNKTSIILKYSLVGISISVVLAIIIIGCLVYLLYIIKQQKELSEIKDDFLGNITHEFKTPIATIYAALEGMDNFNALEDKAKAKRYVQRSRQQLDKLSGMVEKILETASLESSRIHLEKAPVVVQQLLESLVLTYKMSVVNKRIRLKVTATKTMVNADVFHLENALNNVLDNAVKYGGDNIDVTVQDGVEEVFINISDNGGSLTTQQAERIFEKFYRVPKGNVHDVKGYGIGLYYTKNIIEKHGGTIQVFVGSGKTTFEIKLPYE
ncbi:hypothetical protein Y10_08580 [Neptunitalea sp. Y10]|uniref:histidine kinase n=2 Tax=Neptunitalea lumnitzerae TaxID=2965509 RepID=A0ABQ5MGG9_9FLAO|nr:hypothetical protein Y10_08580 [Neptunitalea sp. Y10]